MGAYNVIFRVEWHCHWWCLFSSGQSSCSSLLFVFQRKNKNREHPKIIWSRGEAIFSRWTEGSGSVMVLCQSPFCWLTSYALRHWEILIANYFWRNFMGNIFLSTRALLGFFVLLCPFRDENFKDVAESIDFIAYTFKQWILQESAWLEGFLSSNIIQNASLTTSSPSLTTYTSY